MRGRRRADYGDEYQRAAAIEELPLFQPQPLARLTDPQTSHIAADSMTHAAGVQRSIILHALAEHGPMTADRLDLVCSFRPTTAGRRMVELLELGEVVATDHTELTRSNRPATVYRRVAR